MPRRRKDPGESPIDGDYTKDVVLNKQKGWTYKLLSADDIPDFRMYGFVREERSPDAAHPAYDIGADTGLPDYQVGKLTLYKAPDAIASRLERQSQARADIRMSDIRDIAQASGGHFTTQVHK